MIATDDARKAVGAALAVFSSADPALTSLRPAPDAWTLKEIVGHMIDSACNCHQRLLRLQLAPSLALDLYDAEQWVRVAGYDAYSWPKLLELWSAYNDLIVHMLDRVDPAALPRLWTTPQPPKTLETILEGYFTHMVAHQEHFLKRLLEVQAM